MFDASKKWLPISCLSLFFLIPSCKTNDITIDDTIPPNVIMSSSEFTGISPKFGKKEHNGRNSHYWSWKHEDKSLQVATSAANVGRYFSDENATSKHLIYGYKFFRDKHIDNISEILNVHTKIGVLDTIFFTTSGKTCFSARSIFNTSSMSDWPGGKNLFFIVYCKNGHAILDLAKVKYFLKHIYVGAKGHENPIIGGNTKPILGGNTNSDSGKVELLRESNKSKIKLKRLETKCVELGFTKGTEKFGDCVMKLLPK